MCYLKEAMSTALTETDTKNYLITQNEVYSKHTMHFEQYNKRNKHIHAERREREKEIYKYTHTLHCALHSVASSQKKITTQSAGWREREREI